MRQRLSRSDSLRAAQSGREAQRRQAQSLARAIPTQRDPDLVRGEVRTALVRHATRIVDRDPELVTFVETRVAASHRGEGRPNELPTRTALICFVLLALIEQNFHVLNLPPLLASMSWRTRRALGIDYIDARGVPKQVSYQQLLRAFHAIATAFDPLDGELDDAAANQRSEALRELSFRLVQASISMTSRPADYAVDATLK